MQRGFYVGRFQPVHEGHESVLREIATECDDLIVAIGSADKSHSVDNPFTAGERHVMLTRTLAPLDVEPAVIPIVDVDRNSIWVSHVRSLCPPFDVVFSNHPLVQQLFEEAGYEVRGLPMFNRQEYEGTSIRERMRSGDPWEHLVPDPVVETVHEFDGVARLRNVAADDAPIADGDGSAEPDDR